MSGSSIQDILLSRRLDGLISRKPGPQDQLQMTDRHARGSVTVPRPAVITTAALVPRAPASLIKRGTVVGGVQITARSGTLGKLVTLG